MLNLSGRVVNQVNPPGSDGSAVIIGPVRAVGPRAFAALENYVSVLRRHLDGVGRGRDLVATDPSGYRVAAERIDLDPARDRVVEANRACEWLGYRHDELLATPVSAIHPAEFPQLVDRVTQVRSEQIGWSGLFNCRAQDGTYTQQT
jgi:hypothetical protein